MAMVGAPSAGGDLGSSAPAPGPHAGAPPADVLFTLTATGATLAADTLTLTGVADAALFSTADSQTGIYTTGATCACFRPAYSTSIVSFLTTCQLSLGVDVYADVPYLLPQATLICHVQLGLPG